MAANSPNPMDNEFQAFLDEVEQLSIHHGTAADHGKNDGDSIISVETKKNIADGTNNKSRTNKKNMMANAKDNQKSWSEFKKLDPSCSESKKSNVSFQIKSAKDKKKKKKKKITNKNEVDQENQRATENQDAPSVETAISPLALLGNIDESSYQCPRWTLVIDTCCLIHDNGMGIQNIIDLANHAANAHVRAQNQKNVALATPTVEEPIDIVIPFKVWSELEYQSKSAESKNAYAARTVMRTLRDELESNGINAKGSNKCNALRSQSLLESRDAADKFLSKDSSSTNDDHILACALMENETFGSNTSTSSEVAGGVVIVTLDNNLACKAYANGLKVYGSPSKFQEYYHKRMASLRHRAAGNSVDSDLRR